MGSAPKLSPGTREEVFPKGEILMREGDPSGDLWIIRSGSVDVFKERRGKRFVLAKVKAGEMLGTMTATTGANRTASALATTEVHVTIIPKDQVQKLIKSLPMWANSFIKDLVTRVNYANDLYIEREVANLAFDESPLQFIWRLAMTIGTIAENLAVTRGGKQYLPLVAATKTLGKVIGDEEECGHIIELLIKHGMLKTAEAITDGPHIPVEQAFELSLFGDLIGRMIQEQDPKAPFTMPLALGERKQMSELALMGRSAGASSAQVTLELAAIEESFRKRTLEFSIETLTRAQRMGLVEIDKTAKQPSVRFDPSWVEYSLKSLNLLLDLFGAKAEANAKGPKKTLLY